MLVLQADARDHIIYIDIEGELKPIEIHLIDSSSTKVKLGFVAPKKFKIWRKTVYENLVGRNEV